ncbi:hypothetical protein GH714_035241 [Hevea brasiliensis]|uniref:Disease resistance protein winged helix domain-containing protein n=1 Tax=Hevea brasiliensis TaxID=3981 RepID=A0A6A6N6A4_HEVBR|nr:hypothetical protein GH714_035241 [Hevea brasiliensis]
MEIDVIKELEGAESRSSKKRKNEVQNWLNNVGRLKNDIGTVELEAGPGLRRIQLGKLIEKKTDDVEDLIDQRAASMRGADDICEWRNALRELQESKFREGEMENEVFQALKFSYNRLTNSSLQQCFLYCGLYPEDHRIARDNVIEYLIDEGVIRGESRQAKLDEGHTMLNRLVRVCLLEECSDSYFVKMHDLVRDMAIQIMEVDPGVVVKRVKS